MVPIAKVISLNGKHILIHLIKNMGCPNFSHIALTTTHVLNPNIFFPVRVNILKKMSDCYYVLIDISDAAILMRRRLTLLLKQIFYVLLLDF